MKNVSDHSFSHHFTAMAGPCEVLLAGLREELSQTLLLQAEAEVRRIEKKYSRYLPDSLISRINHLAGSHALVCDEETLGLLKYADYLYQISDGLFDITSGVLRRVWDFKTPVLPNAEALEKTLSLVGWPAVQLEENKVYLSRAGMEIDFGGFGKEYAADRVVELLINAGVKNAYVNLSGDIRAIGAKLNGTPWIMGIRHPRQPGQLIASIPVTTGALASSGDYERYFELKGVRYCHVINPRTGYPAKQWQSISVLASTTVTAGSLSTIAMLKEDQGIAFLEKSGCAYLAVDQHGKIYQKSGASPTKNAD